MRPVQKHLVIEIESASPLLDNLPFWQEMLEKMALAAGSQIVGRVFHKFEPQGLSGVLLLAESHLTVHTWPENNLAALDFYTCGQNCDPAAALPLLREKFPDGRIEVKAV